MKQGGEYAKRLKRLCQQILRSTGRVAAEEPTDPIEQVIIGILSCCSSHSRAQHVFRKLRQQMVDLNELRVTPPMELAQMLDGLPLAGEKAQRIVDALNAIRRRQDSLDLSFLRQRGRREARDYLESLEGVGRGAAASVMLYSLGGHAIPVDDLTLYLLQKEEAVGPSTSIADLQAILERQISASEVHAFAEGLSRYISSRAAKVPIERLPQLLRPTPPAAAPQRVSAIPKTPPPGKPAPPAPKPAVVPVKPGHPAKEAAAKVPAPAKAAAHAAKPAASSKHASPAKPAPSARKTPRTSAKAVAGSGSHGDHKTAVGRKKK